MSQLYLQYWMMNNVSYHGNQITTVLTFWVISFVCTIECIEYIVKCSHFYLKARYIY